MQLTSFIMCRKYLLKIGIILLVISNNNLVIAEPLTYSPDQWPRHWNVLINKTNSQEQINNQRSKGKYINQTPVRSPVWGVVPKDRQKPRRSLRPEYDTNSHMRNYNGQNRYSGNYYSGSTGYALPISYGIPLMNPYGVSAMAPGLAAPGIPFGTYPFVTPSPFMGGYPVMRGMPGPGYLW
jgi:hypothetical protein